jgi:hypothetical protein
MKPNKKYKIDFKQLLKGANWKHPDFAVIARYFESELWANAVFDETVVKEIESNGK